MSIMMRKSNGQVPLSVMQDSGFPPIPSQEIPVSQNQHLPALSIHMPQSSPKYDHHDFPQYKEEISVGVDKEQTIKWMSSKGNLNK